MQRHTTPQRATPHDRGMTLLEVIASLMLLVGVGAMAAGAMSFFERSADRQRVRLAAYEAAHRLILQYLDDAETVNRASAPVEVHSIRFRFAFERELLIGATDAGSVRQRRTGIDYAGVSIEEMLTHRLERVTVRVYPDEPVGGFVPGEPIAELSRIFDMALDAERLLEELKARTADLRDN